MPSTNPTEQRAREMLAEEIRMFVNLGPKDNVPRGAAINAIVKALARPDEAGVPREAMNDAVATIAAVRSTALTDEWAESGEHFHTLCGETLERVRAFLDAAPIATVGDEARSFYDFADQLNP